VDTWGNQCVTNDPGLISIGVRLVAASGFVPKAGGIDKDMNADMVQAPSRGEKPEDISEPIEEDTPMDTVADPLEPLNRIFFHFNDKLYFWILKPLAQGYGAVVPEPARVSVRNFFYNLVFPIRFVNCLFQGKFSSASAEFSRFVVNSTAGIAGFFDPATSRYHIKTQEEDLGQSLGFYGTGPAFFINWPVLGPSNLRDTIGMVGDGFLDPLNYLSPSKYSIGAKGLRTVNKTSLTIGDYEDLKKAALDPYIAVRDAYYQYRQNKIKE
jgi:phospholipid-binding lipoprotein MlaA